MTAHRMSNNGFSSWRETFFEISIMVADAYRDIINRLEIDPYTALLKGERELYDLKLREGWYSLCVLSSDWADEFEQLNAERYWDGEFWDEVREFVTNKLK